jgi:hypothetical protein
LFGGEEKTRRIKYNKNKMVYKNHRQNKFKKIIEKNRVDIVIVQNQSKESRHNKMN